SGSSPASSSRTTSSRRPSSASADSWPGVSPPRDAGLGLREPAIVARCTGAGPRRQRPGARGVRQVGLWRARPTRLLSSPDANVIDLGLVVHRRSCIALCLALASGSACERTTVSPDVAGPELREGQVLASLEPTPLYTPKFV